MVVHLAHMQAGRFLVTRNWPSMCLMIGSFSIYLFHSDDDEYCHIALFLVCKDRNLIKY